MLVKEAKAFGNISTGNTKMPGTTFAIDAFACKTGAKLAKIEGSVCSKCYALRIQKMRPSVDKGYKANLSKWETTTDKTKWEEAMAFQIVRFNVDGYHRWFDAGDLQSLEMLKSIVQVALATPEIKHWLPTREVGIVNLYYKQYKSFPSNLVVRVSSPMVDGEPLPYDNTSTVHSKGSTEVGHACPARHQGNQCGSCRACWNPAVSNVSYPKH